MTDLRRLVDIVWQHATESTAVPSTRTADMLIERAGLSLPPQDGLVMVPRAPTPEMLVAGKMADVDCDMPGQVYRAMIDAALPRADRGGSDG